MSTINPLFVDSTKPIGDKVVTNVELLGATLQPGELLFFEMSDEFGFEQRFAMKVLETKKSVKYTAEVWLKYQHPIQYRFLIVADGEEVQTSAIRNISAGHIISEKWKPCAPEDVVKVRKARAPRKSAASQERKAQDEIKTTSAKPLYEAGLIAQLKSVFDDLL